MSERATQITDLVTHLKRDDCIGSMLVEQGKLTADDVDRILHFQLERGIRFGEAGQELGLIDELSVQEVLARQFDYAVPSNGDFQFGEELVAAHRPFGAQVEALCGLRSELKLRWFDRGHTSLALASVDAEVETSLLAANLGVMFSQAGMRTLVVDANLRCPSQHRIFNLKGRLGMSDMLAKRAGWECILPVAPFGNLFVLPAGTPAPNPQELLGRGTFADLRSAFASRFAVTLYDSAVFGPQADAVSVAAQTEGALLVAVRDKTPLGKLHALSEHLARVHIEIAGAVMVDEER